MSDPVVPRDSTRVIHSSEIADDPAAFDGDYVPLEDHQAVWDTLQRAQITIKAAAPVVPAERPHLDTTRIIHSSEIADDPAAFSGDYVPLEDHQECREALRQADLDWHILANEQRELKAAAADRVSALTLLVESWKAEAAYTTEKDYAIALIRAARELAALLDPAERPAPDPKR